MIDVSAVLTNPRFLTRITVVRRKQTINTFGENRMIEEVYPTQGVLHPEGANALAVRPEAKTNAKSLVLYTRFPVRGESKARVDGFVYQPDLIQWNGNNFLVVHVEDWSNFARGFVKVTAESRDMVDQPPNPKPLDTVNETVQEE